MTTKTELISWLQSPDAIRVVLVEVIDVGLEGGGNASFYFSSLPYISSTTNYDPVIIGGVSFNESIQLDGQASVGFGDIEIENINGERDQWLNNYWNKRNINIYIGDVRWNRPDFYQIFGGLVESINMRDRNVINLILVDKLQRLNEPLQTRTLKDVYGATPVAGTTLDNNKDKQAPIVLGEVFNIEGIPYQDAPATLRYIVNDGPVYDILEVRDNGVPVGFTKNNAAGTFDLTQSSYGQITCTVQGLSIDPAWQGVAPVVTTAISSSGAHQPLSLVKFLITQLGDANSRFDWTTEVDNSTYTAIGTLSTGYGYNHFDIRTGIYCTGGENKLDVVQKLLGSVRVHLIVAADGKLKFVKFRLPSNDSPIGLTVISDSDFEFATSNISEITTPVAQVRLGYNRNYTVQDANLAGSIPDAHKALYKDEYLIQEAFVNLAVQNPYKLSTQLTQMEETTLIERNAQNDEASTRLNIWGVPRKLISLTCYAHLMPIELGEHVHIKTNRFGLANGKNGIVVNIDRSWLTGRVTIGVLI